MKKFLSVLLSAVLLFTMATPAFASTEATVSHIGGYTFQTVTDTEKYTKLKITNNSTGEIEWLEEYVNAEGFSSYIATKGTEQYFIENNGKQVILRDRTQIIETYELQDNSVVFEHFKNGPPNSSNNVARAWSPWGDPVILRNQKSVQVAVLSAVIAVVAAVLKLSVNANIVIAAATLIVSLKLTDIYYETYTWMRYNEELWLYQGKSTTTLYSVSNYTGYIEENTYTWEGSLGESSIG